MTNRRSGFTLVAIAIGALAGCTETVIRLDGQEAFLKPEGCERTICDGQYTRCTERKSSSSSSSGSQCSECWSVCNQAILDVPSCPSTCQSICDREISNAGASAPKSDPCAPELDACKKTSANLGCIDGLDLSSVPYPVAGLGAANPPIEPHQGVCTPGELEAFETECGPSKVTTCYAIDKKCRACLVTPSTADRWGPWIRYDARFLANTAGCVASLGDASCAAQMYASDECFRQACPALDADCFGLATKASCKREYEAADKCEERLEHNPAFEVCFVGNSFHGLLQHFCGQ